MASSLSETPIFYETLAAAASTNPADAAEHFDAIESGETSRIQRFFDEYVAHV